MSNNKRMIYVSPENLEFYDSIENKSEFINNHLESERLRNTEKLADPGLGKSNTGTLQDSVQAMAERDAKALADYRKKNGLYDPTKVK